MVLALRYIPVQDVQFAFEVFTKDFPNNMQPIVDYWENFVGRRLCNVPPQFAVNT